MPKLFLDDAVLRNRYSYDDLIADLNSKAPEFSEYLHTSDTYQVFRACIRALLLELPLVLLDSDFSEEEIGKLVPNRDVLSRRRSAALRRPLRGLEDLVSRLSKSNDATIGFFTSGTTGLPKRVDHRLSTLGRSVKRSAAHADAVWAFAYNATHIAGSQVFLQALLNGSSIVNIFGLKRDAVYAAMNCSKVTHISATPSFYRMLMPLDHVVTSIRRVTFGGERMDNVLAEKLRATFPNATFLNVYASTEAGTILAADGDVFSITEDTETLVKVENEQLYVRSDLLGIFRGSDCEGPWYATGDMVSVLSTDPLRFRIQHRANELINVGGYKVNPDEVESVLRSHEGVADARVYAQRNSVLGSLVCCDLVITEAEVTEKAIRQYLAQNLLAYKIPRVIKFVAAIERARTGKVKRL